MSFTYRLKVFRYAPTPSIGNVAYFVQQVWKQVPKAPSRMQAGVMQRQDQLVAAHPAVPTGKGNAQHKHRERAP